MFSLEQGAEGRDSNQLRQHLLRIFRIPVLKKNYTGGKSDVLI
jgi:hypothetical protein